MPPYTDDEIRQVLVNLQRTRPAYSELLSVYRELFLAQNRLTGQIEPLALTLDRDDAHGRIGSGRPLLSPETFPLDPDALADFLRTVCDLAETAPDPLASCARELAVNLSRRRLDMGALGHALLIADEEALAGVATELGLDAGALRFLLTNALVPLAARFAAKAATLLMGAPDWRRGRCPICGRLPALSTLVEEGERQLICGFCQHQWVLPRILCPACETRDPGAISYFFSQEEAEYRVYTCDTCRFYLKTIDLRQLSRPFYPPAEVLLTLHLDIQAQEQGFSADTVEAVA
jgi:FdhE protein